MGVSQINVHKYRCSHNQENRNCPFCSNIPETEVHFLFDCSLYNGVRLKYLQNIVSADDPAKYDLKFMNSLSEKEVLDFSRYVFYAFKLRSENLNLAQNE